MVCQVFAIPPPCIRPSVKHDSQQRSEDDLSHIIINIIKTNQTLKDKIETNASPNIIEGQTSLYNIILPLWLIIKFQVHRH